jgi:hypothetical protein
MNKKITPEVGDVWGHKIHKTLLHIIEVGGNFITFIGFEDEVYPNKTYRRYHTNTFSSFSDDPRYTNFTEIFEYIGKSKVNISDLFKTENE